MAPRTSVKLKIRRTTRIMLHAPEVLPGPPLYIPHPTSCLPLLRCLWCLTQLDPAVPVKYRKCPCCGKCGTTSFPLASNTIYLEEVYL
jgi:hypothetical protein